VYLCGSLALGDFDPATSDVDVLVVTVRRASDAEFASLKALHDRLPPTGNQYVREYEVYYIDRATIRRFAPAQQHLKVGPDESLHLTEHRANWVLERWTVRELGVTLAGPDPKTLIDPVSADDIRAAVAEELRERDEHWTDGSWPREELGHRGAQGFEVETVCRALCTLESGELTTKRRAIGWALETLPDFWHSLIEWSQQHRKDRTQDDTRIEEVLGFVRWAVDHANMSPE
jgi:Domain of unknown function (DUF4111)/Nucleotidyltransferase domain